MSRKSIAQTAASTTNPPPAMQGGRGVAGSKKARPATCGFRLPKKRPDIQPGKLLKKLGLKLAKATRMVSRRKQTSSCKVSSSSSSATLLRSRSCADPITDDSHRAQAIEDCIEFFNSSYSA